MLISSTTQEPAAAHKVDRQKEPGSQLQELTTECQNEASQGFDTKSALEIARIINHEDAKIAAAVKKAIPETALVIDQVARSLREGGRLIYIGAGATPVIATNWTYDPALGTITIAAPSGVGVSVPGTFQGMAVFAMCTPALAVLYDTAAAESLTVSSVDLKVTPTRSSLEFADF